MLFEDGIRKRVTVQMNAIKFQRNFHLLIHYYIGDNLSSRNEIERSGQDNLFEDVNRSQHK